MHSQGLFFRLHAAQYLEIFCMQPEKPKALTIQEFIQAHPMSRSFFYQLVKTGKAPRLMRLGRRVLISTEAICEWQKRMEVNQ